MNLKIKSYKELTVWKKSTDLVLKTYYLTKDFPKAESYRVIGQMRRAATAIPANMAEGYMRRYTKEYLRFVNAAFASGAELETQLELSGMLGYTPIPKYNSTAELLGEMMKMLNRLTFVLKKQIPNP